MTGDTWQRFNALMSGFLNESVPQGVYFFSGPGSGSGSGFWVWVQFLY